MGGSAATTPHLVLGEAIYDLILMLGPMAPHLCEELWESLGQKGGLLSARFPEPDPSALTIDAVTLVVQVNGKVRARLEVPVGTPAAEVERLALVHPQVDASGGRAPRKVIVVGDQLVNVVG
jgi:leucyl-tRNA synthetase